MKITIRKKLLLCFSMLIISTVMIQLVFNLFFADKLYTLYKQEYMETAFYNIKDAYDGSSDTIADLVNDLEDAQNIQIIISTEEEIIYISSQEFYNSDMVGISGIDNIVPNKEMFDHNPQANAVGIPTNTDEVLRLSGEFTYEGEEIYVQMSLTVASIENSAAFFANSNTVIGVVILLIGILLSIYVSRSITKPIENIEKVSQNLADLQFGEYASESDGSMEIRSLAHSVNRMSDELQLRIEELNNLNEKLQQDVDYQKQMEQMRREFVANVSHEMKTPLAILQFYCENLKCDIEGIDKNYYYDTIIEETNRMDEMVKSMLEISSLENGLAKMEFEKVDISEIANHTIAKLNPLLVKHEVMLNIEPDLCVYGDRRYIEQGIKNYVTNAASHTKESGCIKISLQKEGDFAKLVVYNEGKQIETSQMERIWESFYKSDKSRVRVDNTNVGLGLYIVKCIIENHEGHYGVENHDDGVAFYFEIPLIK
ncbi:MAG: histidine kinase dimerization/phospho-acceptor domain-containing protein [Eubacteriales bacterium]